MTTIRYFIPEDGDSETHPNVFLAPKSGHPGAPPLLGQVKEAFPLPGRYHFRFKSPLIPGGDHEKNGLAVWMDCTADGEPVGIWKNAIVAKVTRISMDDDEDDYDTDEEFEMHRSSNGAPSQAAAAAANAVHQQHASSSNPVSPRASPPPPAAAAADPSLDLFGSPSSAPPSAPHSTASSTGNLLDVDEPAQPAPRQQQQPRAGVGGEPSLLDMSGPAIGHSAPSSAHHDFLGMTAGAPPASSGQPAYGQQQHSQHHQQQQQQQRVHQSMPPQMAQQPQQQRQPPHHSGSFNQQNPQQHQQQQGPFGGLNWS